MPATLTHAARSVPTMRPTARPPHMHATLTHITAVLVMVWLSVNIGFFALVVARALVVKHREQEHDK
jgi:hypothetical protein